MNPEIKQRLDQIRQGEVPEGYKKTNAGIVPNEWNGELLGEYLQEYRQLTNEVDKYQVYSSSRQGLIPQSQYYDKRDAVETNLGYKIVPNGFVTYRHMSDDDVFHFNINKTGSAVLVSSEYPVFTASEKGDLDFIIPILNGTARFRYFCRMQKMGGTRTRLYYKNLCGYIAAMPPLPEQQKIAEILTMQDKLIELQARKIEQLQALKKACLQRMFPKKGCDRPEIRFPEFTDAWEQRELGTITSSYSGGTPTAGKSEYYNGDIPFIRSGEINEEKTELFLSELGYNNSSAAMVDKGDILYALYGATSGEVSISKLKGAINQAILAIKPNEGYDSEFIMQWLKNQKENIISTYLQGGQGNLSATIVKSLKIDITTYEEQQQIGAYFKSLDHLITLHQRKLDEEKQKKKALMQLLLTGIVRVK